ncbi:uncharacterized protein DUF87 [Thermosporothrix hazakensis]|jgi:DNA helicase HerA-like ATPase|uniref:Uncharacterized protein DUF87 n=1 Tax=Thermosporothrix hazakensis TaxID=644383 RepID=A0A326U2Q2_THEHA|nr:ATP-binding protein [Thermosporothrix hazakensis]PZW25320.1 uncharacterized protein DUF87 [Thermosporothrix hazakensis]GCE50551.1 hypothetical protein KTH_54200 [Thermosporothrix hazakensis]
MKIGSVYDQTTTTEFVAMLRPEYDGEKLLFSYVELALDGGTPQAGKERIVARIISVYKENPLLSRDQAGVSASMNLEDLGINFSRRFTYGWARCSVLGTLTDRGLDINRRGIAPNAEVHTPSEETLRKLFFHPSPSYVPLGSVDTFGGDREIEVPVTLNADQLATKHFCIFGMTGSGKTTTAAKLIEEFMARGHRMILFDSHDDYENLELFTQLFKEYTRNGKRIDIQCPVGNRACNAVQYLLHCPDAIFRENRPKNEQACERLLRTASVMYKNEPARKIVKEGCKHIITADFVRQLVATETGSSLLKKNAVQSLRVFPELKYYGDKFADFSIVLLQAFQGESFSSAQRRVLRRIIKQEGTGEAFIARLHDKISKSRLNPVIRDALLPKLEGIKAVYQDAKDSNANPLDFELFFKQVADRSLCLPESVFRLSLSDLSSNLRKALVYGIVTYFFRSFKFGEYSVRPKGKEKPAHSILFILEEARSLIPRSFGIDDNDVAGTQAKRAMRELAYEGRKFSLGFGIISQKPSTVDPEVVSQANTFILHQLKSPEDQEYVRTITESMSREELDMIKNLGTGRAIVAGVAVQSPVLLNVYPRYSEEGIQEPTPLKDALSPLEAVRKQLGIE